MTGDEFTSWRKRVGLTQDGVAERFKVSRSTVQNWESGANPVPHYADQMCEVWEDRLLQENGGIGPVTLTYADGPMWVDAYSPRRMAMLKMEPFRTNSAALGRVLELWGTSGFHVPSIVLEDDKVLWDMPELSRVASGQDTEAPVPARWRAKVIANIADYVRKVAIRYPVRSGPRLWTREETAVWEAKVLAAVEPLDALTAEAQASTATLKRVEDALSVLRELGVFPLPEAHHQLVAAFQ